MPRPPTRKAPTPASGKTTVRLPKSVHRRVALLAARDAVSINEWLVAAIAAHVSTLAHAQHLAEEA